MAFNRLLLPSNLLTACMFEDTDAAINTDEIPIVVEMNKQFGSPGSTVNLSGQDLSDWISMQSLCARLSRSDNAKSIIYLDHCCLGRHGAAIVSRSFTHVLIRAGSYVAKWLPLMHPNGRIIVLSMINNDIGPDGAAAVSKMLRVNSGLRELNLRFNNLRPDGAQYLASALYVNDTLRFLCVSGNDLCGVGEDEQGEIGEYDLTGVAALFRALQVNTRLRTLKIAENDIGNDGAKCAADALKENKCLRALDVHGNALFSVLEEELAAAIQIDDSLAASADGEDSESDSGRAPDLSPDQEVSAVIETIIRRIESDGGETTSLAPAATKISTGHSCIVTAAAAAGAGGVRTDVDKSTARGYRIPHEFTGMEGGGALLTAIGASEFLVSVDLSWNDMGPLSASLLATALANNSVLHYLDFHGNPIGDIGVGALAAYLMSETCVLGMLCLQRVDMTEVGAALLGEALRVNNSVSKLNISCNDVGARGSEKLAFGLRKNTKLSDLNMRSCRLCSEGISHIANMLQYNCTITILNLSCNDVDDHGATALAATIAQNSTLVTLDISNFTDKSLPNYSADADQLYVPLSTLVTPFASVLDSSVHPLSHQSNSRTDELADTLTGAAPSRQMSKKVPVSIGIEGSRSLALMLKSKTNLQKLIMNGHELSGVMCNELLTAMDETRICTVIADFNAFKWKYDEVLNAMQGERNLLASCYTPKTLRVHLCGQASAKKSDIVRGWCRHQQHVMDSLWTNMFQSQAVDDDTPGLEISKVLLQNRCAEVCIWNYEGSNEIHDIWRLHLRAAPLSVAVVVVSSVGSAGQCRSALQVAAEVCSWIRTLLTFGHKTREIAVIMSNGAAFEKAWKGLHPNSAGGMALEEVSVDASTASSAETDMDSSIGSMPVDSATFYDPNADLHSRHAHDVDQSLLDAAARKSLISSAGNPPSPTGADGEVVDQSEDNVPTKLPSADVPLAPDSEQHDVISSIHTVKLNDAGMDGSMSSFSSPSKVSRSATLLIRPSAKNPTEEKFVPPEGVKPDRNAELRRQFEESVRESISAALGWRRTPMLYVWEEGTGGAMPPSLDTWLSDRYKSMAHHVQVPSICEALRERCLPLLRQSGTEKVMGMDSLLVAARTVVRCLQPLQLRQACHWLHLLGDVVVLDTEEVQPHQAHLWRGITPQVPESKARRGLMESGVGFDADRIRGSHTLDGRTSKLAHDMNTKKYRIPKRMCKIVLDPSWLVKKVLVPLLCRSPSLSKNQAALQPWCDKEYILNMKEIEDYIAPLRKSLNMSLSELITALEVQRIGVHLTHMASFCVPNRILGDKLNWLEARGVVQMPLSQYSGNYSKLSEASAVSVVLGRRIKAKYPHLFPPSTFHCVQSQLLHIWVRQKASSWQHHRLMCWDRGVGITIEQPPAHLQKRLSRREVDVKEGGRLEQEGEMDATPVFKSGAGGGFICIIIETVPAWQQGEWSQNPNGDIDILAWGEGACTAEAIHAAVESVVRTVYSAVQTVCMGALRSEDETVEALTTPTTDWLRLAYLRPGCVLHTLAGYPSDRNCGEYIEDADCVDPPDAPVMVECSHLQPRLCKQHLRNGYVVADSPGSGKGFLRSVFSALEKGLEGRSKSTTPNGGAVTGLYLNSSTASKANGNVEQDDGVDFQCTPIMASE